MVEDEPDRNIADGAPSVAISVVVRGPGTRQDLAMPRSTRDRAEGPGQAHANLALLLAVIEQLRRHLRGRTIPELFDAIPEDERPSSIESFNRSLRRARSDYLPQLGYQIVEQPAPPARRGRKVLLLDPLEQPSSDRALDLSEEELALLGRLEALILGFTESQSDLPMAPLVPSHVLDLKAMVHDRITFEADGLVYTGTLVPPLPLTPGAMVRFDCDNGRLELAVDEIRNVRLADTQGDHSRGAPAPGPASEGARSSGDRRAGRPRTTAVIGEAWAIVDCVRRFGESRPSHLRPWNEMAMPIADVAATTGRAPEEVVDRVWLCARIAGDAWIENDSLIVDAEGTRRIGGADALRARVAVAALEALGPKCWQILSGRLGTGLANSDDLGSVVLELKGRLDEYLSCAAVSIPTSSAADEVLAMVEDRDTLAMTVRAGGCEHSSEVTADGLSFSGLRWYFHGRTTGGDEVRIPFDSIAAVHLP